jgi:uncharacterized protein (DUF1330 family)
VRRHITRLVYDPVRVSAYVIVDVEVTNPDGYREYQQQVAATFAPFGGRFAVRGGRFELLEGTWDVKRLVMLEFPDVDRVKAWYTSPEYQAILPIRLRNATTHFITVVEGV